MMEYFCPNIVNEWSPAMDLRNLMYNLYSCLVFDKGKGKAKISKEIF